MIKKKFIKDFIAGGKVHSVYYEDNSESDFVKVAVYLGDKRLNAVNKLRKKLNAVDTTVSNIIRSYKMKYLEK